MCGCVILCTQACICTSMLWVCMFVFAVWGFIVLLCLVAVEQQVCRQAFSIQVSCFGQNWAQEWCVSQSWYWDWATDNTNREDSLLGGRLFIFFKLLFKPSVHLSQVFLSPRSHVCGNQSPTIWQPLVAREKCEFPDWFWRLMAVYFEGDCSVSSLCCIFSTFTVVHKVNCKCCLPHKLWVTMAIC